ncbi:MAG: tRNA uridine-5-carboxymethylaminomethyl(34) synthesis GTPase MnmE [Qingshengfaniella sp.]
MDTIYALASAQGKAGVSVMRVSGPAAQSVLRALAGRLTRPRIASLVTLTDPDGLHLDQALCVYFQAGASFTGEDVVEFHLHGSRAVVQAMLQVLSDQPGCRLAEPGEFTRRALDNGCLDLTEVEGLADLIEAETEEQRRQALRLLSGELGQRVEIWRKCLIRAMALLEATIDFADEEVPVDVGPEVLDLIEQVEAGLHHDLAGQKVAERIRDGFEVAILGPPNIGKSTLLNMLAGRDAALTSDIAGTTRDVIEVRMDLNGLPVTFLDTAGLRQTEDHVEAMGIDRALKRAESADLRIVLTDGSVPDQLDLQKDDLVLQGKADLLQGNIAAVSGLTGRGVDRLVADVCRILAARASHAGSAVHERHRIAIAKTATLLESARSEIEAGQDRAEFAAEALRQSVLALDALVGRIDVEHVLDEIFRSFCLGK